MSKLSKLVNKLLSTPPEASFSDVAYVLEKFGFAEVRSSGSHHMFRHPDGRMILIPKVGGKKVKRTYIQQVVALLDLESWEE